MKMWRPCPLPLQALVFLGLILLGWTLEARATGPGDSLSATLAPGPIAPRLSGVPLLHRLGAFCGAPGPSLSFGSVPFPTGEKLRELLSPATTQEAVSCTKCGREMQKDWTRCPYDGEVVPRVCPKCNTAWGLEYTFCPRDGARLDGETEVVPTPRRPEGARPRPRPPPRYQEPPGRYGGGRPYAYSSRSPVGFGIASGIGNWLGGLGIAGQLFFLHQRGRLMVEAFASTGYMPGLIGDESTSTWEIGLAYHVGVGGTTLQGEYVNFLYSKVFYGIQGKVVEDGFDPLYGYYEEEEELEGYGMVVGYFRRFGRVMSFFVDLGFVHIPDVPSWADELETTLALDVGIGFFFH